MPGITSPSGTAVALDGAGGTAVAWREPGARPAELLSARYWADLGGSRQITTSARPRRSRPWSYRAAFQPSAELGTSPT